MGRHPLYNESGLQKNNKSHVMYALADKQMELKQLQKEYEDKILKIESDLEAMEKVLCLFDEDCDKTLEKINLSASLKRKPYEHNRYFKRGEAKSLVLKVLRGKNHSMKARDIAIEIQSINNMRTDNKLITNEIVKVIQDTLRGLFKKKLVVKDDLVDTITMWKIQD